MTDEPILKPCPFCGEAEYLEVQAYDGGMLDAYVQCNECSTYGPDGGTRDDAIIKWNHRPSESK